ncbi:MAG TPA: hypothetical protein VJM33_12130 [Microthrixaceae bacterium]|nr:hypothetical protein [Microthrixaceae bacterium]
MTTTLTTGRQLRSLARIVGAALCALAALAIARHGGPDRLLVATLALGLIPMAIYLMVHRRLPDELVLAQLLIVVAAAVAVDATETTRVSVHGAFGAVLATAVLIGLRVLWPALLTAPEVKEAVPVGYGLAAVGWTVWVLGLAVAVIFKGGLVMIAEARRADVDTLEVPFGVAMAASALGVLALTG